MGFRLCGMVAAALWSWCCPDWDGACGIWCKEITGNLTAFYHFMKTRGKELDYLIVNRDKKGGRNYLVDVSMRPYLYAHSRSNCDH